MNNNTGGGGKCTFFDHFLKKKDYLLAYQYTGYGLKLYLGINKKIYSLIILIHLGINKKKLFSYNTNRPCSEIIWFNLVFILFGST